MSVKTHTRPEGSETERDQTALRPLPGLPEEVAQYIGDRPILRGEDPRVYDALFSQIAAFVAAADQIEWIWTKDIVDAVWEARPARRARSGPRAGSVPRHETRGRKSLAGQAGNHRV